MATDSPSHGPRRHFHRGRRGHDRRGGERRNPPQQQPQRQAGEQARGENVDVEQIMRDIRSNIVQRHGVELTDQQVQELAARRLESILDPRTIKPSLLDQLRRAAGARPEPSADRAEPPYTFEDTTLFESPNGFVRFMRKLLAPILKLFFNPNPLIRALNIQARLNTESVKREAERDQRQAEWNALHYELLQRVVSETAKVSLEMQSLALRVESLAAKVDFNERRVRGIEGTVHQARPAGQKDRDRDRDRDRERERDRDRDREVPTQPEATRQPQASTSQTAPEPVPPQVDAGTPDAAQGEAPRRRRRRRRGRRGAGSADAAAQGVAAISGAPGAIDADEGDEEIEPEVSAEASATPGEQASVRSSAEAVTTEGESVAEPTPVDVTGRAVSLPEPERELPPAVGQRELGPDHLLEPATTSDDSTPERGER